MISFVACAEGIAPKEETTNNTTDGGGGAGGSDAGPCGIDCSTIPTLQCTIAVCNTGQQIGEIGKCVVIPSVKGTPCEDGKFCSTNDSCDGNGACEAGPQNECGINHAPCEAVICYEDDQSCDVTPVSDGDSCVPTDLCQTNGVCHVGQCIGEPKDCSFSPLFECNKVSCDPQTGKCKGTPDPDKDNHSCVLTGDVCQVNRTCQNGICAGGTPKDCSALNVGCQIGECDPANGLCDPKPAPVGTPCSEGIPECAIGACDVKGECLPSIAPNGSDCNDYNSCTTNSKCQGGFCQPGQPVAGCTNYLFETFEACQNGWTLADDWQCGKPQNVGPDSAHIGLNVMATQVAGVYHVNQSYSSCVADSPTINLSGSTAPFLSFWAWDKTEGGTFDGWNVKVSANGGAFAPLMTMMPAYPLTIAGEPAYGGDHSQEGWVNYTADLSAFKGQSIALRFSFHSDGATVFPGVYVDDVVVAEPDQIPLFITTTSPLTDTYAGMDYSVQFQKVGGTPNAKWSKVGGTNADWLIIDPNGVGHGPPSLMQAGPVSVTVRVEEPAPNQNNFAEKTFNFNVLHDAYYTSFEGPCPNGWTLTGDWQCGVPAVAGPAAAYVGTQCLATVIGGKYNNLQTWAGATATSPDIDLTASPAPILTFRMYIDTEGSTYDGVNLKISNDGGQNYNVVNSVLPAYPLTIAGEPAWGGHHSGLGWQLMQADLSANAGQIVRLRFSFQSDSSGTFAGVYIDDFFVD